MASGPLNSPAAPSAPMSQGDVMQAARDFNPPPVVPLSMPTMRPDEHVMTGVAQPPAPPMAQTPVLKGVALLNALGDSASPEVKALRQVLSVQQGNEQAP